MQCGEGSTDLATRNFVCFSLYKMSLTQQVWRIKVRKYSVMVTEVNFEGNRYILRMSTVTSCLWNVVAIALVYISRSCTQLQKLRIHLERQRNEYSVKRILRILVKRKFPDDVIDLLFAFLNGNQYCEYAQARSMFMLDCLKTHAKKSQPELRRKFARRFHATKH